MPTSEFPGRLSRLSRRVNQLGSGVFARNDQRKQSYSLAASSAGSTLPQLLDLSLGSTDLLPPAAAIEAIRSQLAAPESAAYCLHAATAPLPASGGRLGPAALWR